MGAGRATQEALTRIQYIRRALDEIAGPDPKLVAEVNRDRHGAARHQRSAQRRSDSAPRQRADALPSLLDRVNTAVNGLTTTAPPTATHREALAIAQQQVGPLLDRLHKLIEVDLANVEKQMNAPRRAVDAGEDSAVAAVAATRRMTYRLHYALHVQKDVRLRESGPMLGGSPVHLPNKQSTRRSRR